MSPFGTSLVNCIKNGRLPGLVTVTLVVGMAQAAILPYWDSLLFGDLGIWFCWLPSAYLCLALGLASIVSGFIEALLWLLRRLWWFGQCQIQTAYVVAAVAIALYAVPVPVVYVVLYLYVLVQTASAPDKVSKSDGYLDSLLKAIVFLFFRWNIITASLF